MGIKTPTADRILPRVVRWLTPPRGKLKLNVDGAYKRSINSAGGGGIIRDCHGDIIHAFASYYPNVHSSFEAEALALVDGLSLCVQLNLSTQHNHH
jgi:Reverse transcriptase-like